MSIKKIIFSLFSTALLVACASMGHPDGGPYDEEPPVFVGGSPAPYATNVTDGRIVLEFDENIRLENAFEKVVISPPQLEQPQIKYSGKKIIVQLQDTLIPNTTYSIDFNDAIVDNNEGNPMMNFSYVFSTGSVVDTLGVSGTVLNASDLEPIKGILVGLHPAADDSAFVTKPFVRVARTDSRGRFTIKGVAPGEYKAYALSDVNGNYLFDQKSEAIAFDNNVISPRAVRSFRNDTVWRDSVTIDTVRSVEYTHYYPDDIVLRAFNEEFFTQYLVKYPRLQHSNFTIYFSAPNSELPKLDGLNFDAKDAYILEANATMDTLRYWFKDSTVYNMDTLKMAVTYNVPDSMLVPVSRTDTLFVTSKKRRETVLKEEAEAYEKEKKKFLKKAKRSKDYDENNPPLFVPRVKPLPVKTNASISMDINNDLKISFEEPLAAIDASRIHLMRVKDSVSTPIPFVFEQSKTKLREYYLYAEWRPEEKYSLCLDSAAFTGLYGAASEKIEREIGFRSLDDYAVLYLTIPRTGNDAVVQMINSSGVVTDSQRTEAGKCSFFFIQPGRYSLRLFIDENKNGKWDTGLFEDGVQPEKVYYYPRVLDLRALFEYEQDDWDITAPLEKQKPLEVTKQKPDEVRKKMNRNATRKF